MELTDEQDKVADSQAKSLVVNAFAGAGKTWTLVEYARRRPNDRLLYVAFNRAIKEDAATKFPKNVRCMTTHGLAFPSHGNLYKTKLGNPKAFHLARAMELDIVSAGRVLEVITSFLISTDQNITERHAIFVSPKTNMSVIGTLVDYARRGWQMMQDTGNTSVPMPHDGYLKLYQLSRPQINTGIILFDECQDANPVALDIIASQRAGKVFVGDKYQAIYGFRGAVDALADIEADQSLLLTSSFRFGDGIAQIATALLHDWRDCRNPVRGRGEHQSVFKVDQGRPHAVISRTNGRLFAEAVTLASSDMPFGFAGGVEGYRFEQILDAYHLFRGQRDLVRDQFLASFPNFTQMRQYGDELDDKEVKALVNVIDEYLHDIPSLIDEIKTRAVPKLTGDEVALSTAHKAKGLEWMDVVLTDDYTELRRTRDDDTGELVGPEPEEVNILYVAATRAKRGLCLPASVRDWLAETGRYNLLQPACLETTPSTEAKPAPFQTRDATMEMAGHFKQIDGYLGDLHRFISSSSPDMAEAVAHYLRGQADKFAPTSNPYVRKPGA